VKLIVVGGPPSVGKTSLLVHTLTHLKKRGRSLEVIKLDCLNADDGRVFESLGVRAVTGLSSYVCPDHYLASNIDRMVDWGRRCEAELLVIESAGLCNRCSPHLKGVLAVAVLDMLSGINTPRKVGPQLRSADLVVLTRGDRISQAEREVFRIRVGQINRRATILELNGLTGQGTQCLADRFDEAPELAPDADLQLRYPMPSAVCSFCIGERRVGQEFASGNVRLMSFPDEESSVEKGEAAT